ncbi:DUF7669 domain-containing protein [Salsipaludibacter albus]|uniref:DUF7669 domain-containing protein n=1 Tax=Salsipaludibacter albus TaxID=2849650 RepID=UPI001EE4E599|nr:hypothetical protein [Salsipaludibacter albus]MBY5162107.1 hypothetical protein [Salsipaludibacter albus]
MGAREDLLDAARALTERGRSPFSPSDLIREARAQGSAYKSSTLRTHIVGYMREGAKNHWGTKYEDFRRVGSGRYVLTEQAGRPDSRTDPEPTQDGPPNAAMATRADEPVTDHRAEWSWEGNVQSSVVAHLSAEQWKILRVADTHSREHGIDVQAKRRRTQLSVEVKGYPSSVYARGPKAGQPKVHNLASQARAYFSDALLTGLVMRGDDSNARVVLAFPRFTTYENLAARTIAPLASADIEVWFVDEGGTVTPFDVGAGPAGGDAPVPPPAPDLTTDA